MKIIKKWALLTAIILVISFGLTACNITGKISEIPITGKVAEEQSNELFGNQFELLAEASDLFFKENRIQIMEPADVYNKVLLIGNPNYYVVDLRLSGHFAGGSIQGSVNIPYSSTWRMGQIAKLPKDKKLVLVCYSGHTASQTAAFWTMLGYDVAVMRYGMAGWTKNKDIIGSGTLPCAPFDNPISQEPIQFNDSYTLPGIDEEVTNLAELIAKQSEKFLTSGKGSVITIGTVQTRIVEGNEDGLLLVDIRQSQDYQAGHLPGAINIPFQSLAEPANLEKLPSDKTVVLICYNGHFASQAARVLNQLGYETVAMKDGMSAWTPDSAIIGANPIDCSWIVDYPTVYIKGESDETGVGCS
ncbi:MAG: rhodanese-like domain-containing protein [Clostridia bacterium]|jgi:rhodanese-related sulfurtransferase|nr:rhodanese-like domain-containing protein [Clostridia bacterium]